jgi:hypothetical protein
VEARGLSDKILLVASGEMGRTPKINTRGGRDHWSRLAPLLLYGGGIRPGVIGQSTRDGAEPDTDRPAACAGRSDSGRVLNVRLAERVSPVAVGFNPRPEDAPRPGASRSDA